MQLMQFRPRYEDRHALGYEYMCVAGRSENGDSMLYGTFKASILDCRPLFDLITGNWRHDFANDASMKSFFSDLHNVFDESQRDRMLRTHKIHKPVLKDIIRTLNINSVETKTPENLTSYVFILCNSV